MYYIHDSQLNQPESVSLALRSLANNTKILMRVQQCVRFARYARSLSITYLPRSLYIVQYYNRTTVIEMVEMVEILDGRLRKRSVEPVRYVINNLLHLVIVKYGDISPVLCISTRLRFVTILSLLMKYLVIFHADSCNKSYIII